MTKNQLIFLRCIIFIAGAGIIVLALFLTKSDRELDGIDAFIWTLISLMYLVFSLFFLFSAINNVNFTKKIPSLALFWTDIVFYIASSIIILLLLIFFHALSINIVIIIQAALLFIFFLHILFAYFASYYTGNVAVEEPGKQQYLNQIKSKAQILLLLVNKLPADFTYAQKILKQSIKQIKSIHPLDKGAGNDLELQILQSLTKLLELCNMQGAIPVGLEGESEKLLIVVKKRKSLRN